MNNGCVSGYSFLSLITSGIQSLDNIQARIHLRCFCRFIQYKATSLEKTFKYDLLTEHDLGVTIDLINPDTYKINPNGELENQIMTEDVC